MQLVQAVRYVGFIKGLEVSLNGVTTTTEQNKARLVLLACLPFDSAVVLGDTPQTLNITRIPQQRLKRVTAAGLNKRVSDLQGSLMAPDGIDWHPDGQPSEVYVGLVRPAEHLVGPRLQQAINAYRPHTVTALARNHWSRTTVLIMPARDNLDPRKRNEIEKIIKATLLVPWN